MNRNVQSTESSLLLQLPKSVFSFSDMSGNSFLLPVAVENVVANNENLQNTSNLEKQEVSQVTETSVCQLQQPLLMRKSSSDLTKMAVPCTESSTSVSHMETIQAGTSHIKPQFQSSASNQGIQNQYTETQNWPAKAVINEAMQANTVFPGFQNQFCSVQSEPVSQLDSLHGKSVDQLTDQEVIHSTYQTVYPQQSTVASVNQSGDFVPLVTSVSDGFPNKTSEYHNPNFSAVDYYSQPPVITPSTAPAYYNSNRQNESNLSQAIYPSMTNQNYVVPTSCTTTPGLYNWVYETVKPYWLFKDIVETKEIWYGFSGVDSNNLEMAFHQDPQAVVPVDGGRYDALLSERIKKPVYFDGKDLQIRRCTWFYCPGTSQRFVPFPEVDADLLEQHYSSSVTSGQWEKRVNIPGIGTVCLENPQLLLFYKNEVDLWPSLPDSKTSPKVVKRGLPENFEIMPNESNCIDHLIFIVQGIGSFCDLRFRTVSECVDGFRDIANKLLISHFRHEVESGKVGRVEFLPLAWHAKLHTSDKGFDRCMQNITLPSIPKLRHFTNDTLLDILLYSSPSYCQSIIDTVASELNKLYEIFLKRNPGFSGKVFVAGHSLGSLILFDILANQKAGDKTGVPSDELPIDNRDSKTSVESDNCESISKDNIKDPYTSIESLLQACHLDEYVELFEKEKIDFSSVAYLSNDDLKDLGLPTGPRKKLLNAIHSTSHLKDHLHEDETTDLFPVTSLDDKSIHTTEDQRPSNDADLFTFPFKTSPCMSSVVYPRLHFEPACFFALGSPISMFLTVRGYDAISEDFRFPTCPGFFHIFHPYDPVAFRIEPLIDSTFSAKPVLIPHHKGRKRMHLEIRENLSKVGFEIKQKVLETLRYTWNSLSGFAKSHTLPSAAVEAEVDKLVNQQISESEYEVQAPSETSGEDIQIGSLNGGRRIDYVLQEKPIEALNDYIFALTSHATYWDSEDTVLMILQEIYATQGIYVSSTQSIENKPFSHLEGTPHETFSHLNSVMSDPCLYESAKVEQVPRNIPSFYNQSQNVPPVIPVSSENIPSVNNSAATLSYISNTVPPPATITQPVGPPPLTGFIKRSPFAK